MPSLEALQSLTRLVADCELLDNSDATDLTDLIFRLSVQLKNLQVEVDTLNVRIEELHR